MVESYPFQLIGQSNLLQERNGNIMQTISVGDLVYHPWSTDEKPLMGIVTEVLNKQDSLLKDDLCYIKWQFSTNFNWADDEVQKACYLTKVY